MERGSYHKTPHLSCFEPVYTGFFVRFLGTAISVGEFRSMLALVDAADYEWLSQYKWYAGRPTPSGTIYARRRASDGTTVLMHRMIMRPPKGMVVDHINGNGLDNRRCNLRICTVAENTSYAPKRAGGKSRFIGVAPSGNKWQAKVGSHYLGVFDDEVEAAKARDRKARELYGVHAWLNFPLEDPPDGEQERQPAGCAPHTALPSLKLDSRAGPNASLVVDAAITACLENL